MNMSKFNLRNYFLKEATSENTGGHIVIIITLGVGFIVASAVAIAYSHPVVILSATVTGFAFLFSFVQVIRKSNGFLHLPTALALFTVIAVALLEGKGFHDLIWLGNLGIYILVNTYSAKSTSLSTLIFGVIGAIAFSGTGYLEITGVLPNQLGTTFQYWLVNTFLMLGIMAIITAVFHNNRALLQSARDSRFEEMLARERLEKLNTTLEEQVQSRVNELRNVNDQLLTRTAKLQAASEISQEITENPFELTADLLNRTARLVSEKLGYYHVGVFLIDTMRGFAVLHAATSKGGQQMLAKRHQLKVGGAGIVGYVSQSGRPRIAQNTGADAVYFNNPYLQETRSEISLPIKFANTIIGVLDVQSTQASAFSEEDTNTLMTIANQLAVILHLKEVANQQSNPLRNTKRSYKTLTWEKQAGYSYRPDGSIVSNTEMENNSIIEKAVHSGEPVVSNRSSTVNAPVLVVPVKFREIVIGLIHIEAAENNRMWTEDEIRLVQAVSDRAALAIENARLFENATRRAEQEETISRVTNQIGASTDFERILQTTIQELGLALGASRSYIKIGTQTTPADDKAAQQ